MSVKTERVPKWYFGGLSSCCAVCFTHPLDTIKVTLQTQQEAKLSFLGISLQIIKKDGFLALYSGLSASLLRQITYSTTRFGIYEVAKQKLSGSKSSGLPFFQSVLIAGVAGGFGGFLGTPGDMINVRMQNDVKLPLEQRRNYKHAIDGVFRVLREEGVPSLFRGAISAILRGICMNIGQVAFYDQFKKSLLGSGYFEDNIICHLSASLCAAWTATAFTQPIDVIKTRAMNAKPGEFRNLWHIVTYTGRLGPQGFFKGFIPAFIRLGPQTVLIFVFFEQFRKRFGVEVTRKS